MNTFRPGRSLSSPLLLAVVAALLVAASPGRALALSLGLADGFNVYAIGDIDAWTSDYQGTVGAGGNVSFTDFGIGQSLDGSLPVSLAVGGTVFLERVEVAGGGLESGGTATVRNSFISGDLASGGNVSLIESTVLGDVRAAGTATVSNSGVNGSISGGAPYSPTVDHAAVANDIRNASSSFGSLGATGVVQNEFGELVLVGTSGTNVFELAAADIDAAWGIELRGPSDATFIVNVLGGTVDVSSMAFELTGGVTRERILYNLIDAQLLDLFAVGVQGTILAPFAVTSFSNGLLEGSLYVASLTGTGQVNDHRFGSTPIPEPATLSLALLGGAALLGGRRRRRGRAA